MSQTDPQIAELHRFTKSYMDERVDLMIRVKKLKREVSELKNDVTLLASELKSSSAWHNPASKSLIAHR